MRVTVLYNEPEISRYTAAGEQAAVEGVLVEVAAVTDSLTELGHQTQRVGLQPPLSGVRQKLEMLDTDLIFNLFEGFGGSPESEPAVAAVCESLRIPFTGCPSSALTVALKKTNLKKILSKGGIKVPDSQLVNLHTFENFRLGFPCIVKPESEDASHGITRESVVINKAGLRKQVTDMIETFGYPEVMVEEYVEGREFNAAVLGNRIPSMVEISEIVFELPEDMPKILTYAGKWDKDSLEYKGTTPVCPPVITETERAGIKNTVEKSFSIAGCQGYARVDMRMDAAGNIYVLEVNPNPDISPDSGAALQAKTAGINYTEFIEKIVKLALEAGI